MFQEERLEKIINLLSHKKRLSVKHTSELFTVSSDTIRRDFDNLAEKGIAVRTHGGIVLGKGLMQEESQKQRFVQNYKQKEKIAQKAVSLIKDSEIIVIDSGTTTFMMTKYLSGFSNLKIFTNSISIASEISNNPNISTVVFGGEIRNSISSITGPDTINMCQRYHTDKLFLSITAVSLGNGLMNPNRLESEVKMNLIKMANEIIVLADSSKINKVALFSFCSLNEISTFITDSNANNDFLDELKKLGISVITVDF
jgi:DeoR/GlpR family transcriptional regulator of sugar metabolism